MEKIRDLGILTIYCALIYYISSQPHIPMDTVFPHQDKLAHLSAYAIMGFLAWRSFRHFVHEQPVLAFCCIGFCGLYGLTDEIHQLYVPGRSASPYDLIADIIGAIISVLLIRFFKPTATFLF